MIWPKRSIPHLVFFARFWGGGFIDLQCETMTARPSNTAPCSISHLLLPWRWNLQTFFADQVCGAERPSVDGRSVEDRGRPGFRQRHLRAGIHSRRHGLHVPVNTKVSQILVNTKTKNQCLLIWETLLFRVRPSNLQLHRALQGPSLCTLLPALKMYKDTVRFSLLIVRSQDTRLREIFWNFGLDDFWKIWAKIWVP